MSNRNISIRAWWALFFTVTAITGCGGFEKPAQYSTASRADCADLRLDSNGTGHDVLRIRADPLRNRLWVLTLDEVRIYDTATADIYGAAPAEKRLMRRIALPHWSVVGLRNVCMPDMALDRAGAAFISSNGQARLLRIDADRFDLKDYAISFPERAGLDIGFGALAFVADGTLLARTTPGGLLWEIDINKARAVRSKSNKKLPLDQCALTTEYLKDL